MCTSSYYLHSLLMSTQLLPMGDFKVMCLTGFHQNTKLGHDFCKNGARPRGRDPRAGFAVTHDASNTHLHVKQASSPGDPT